MKTRNSLAFLVLLSCASSFSCKDDNVNIYEGCCATPAVEISIGEGQVFIPNIFTPNKDGVNESFLVFGKDIEYVEKFSITDLNGNLLFETEYVPPNFFGEGWNPAFDEKPYKGLFNYTAIMNTPNNYRDTVVSTACSMICKTKADSVLLVNKMNCRFGTQHDGQGRHNPMAPSLEDIGCF